MAAFTQLPTPVDITPADDGTYKDIDVTADVSNASGVLIRIRKVSASANDFFVRKKGSTDDLTFQSGIGKHQYIAVGIDVDDVLQIKLQSSGAVWEVDLIGYYNSDDFVFFDEVKTLAPTAGVWSDFDISSHTGADTAIAAICWTQNNSSLVRGMGFREKGSTDNFINPAGSNSFNGTPTVGCDGSEVFQVYRATTSVGDMYCIGYAKSGVTMNTNAVDNSISTAAAWTDLPDDLKNGAFLELFSPNLDELWGVRPDGDTDYTFYDEMKGNHTWTPVGSVAGTVEAQIETTDVEIRVNGTIDDAGGGPTTTPVSATASAVGTASLATVVTYSLTNTATAIGTSSISKLIAKTLAVVGLGSASIQKTTGKTLTASATGTATEQDALVLPQSASTGATGTASSVQNFIAGTGAALLNLVKRIAIRLGLGL